jgi:small subunit ribosomal protein S20
MPVIPNAIRKLRADKKRGVVNLRIKRALRLTISAMRKKPSEKKLVDVFSKLDKAVKGEVIHKNKAARLKSRLSALVGKK